MLARVCLNPEHCFRVTSLSRLAHGAILSLGDHRAVSRWFIPPHLADSARAAPPPGGLDVSGNRFIVGVVALASSIGLAKLITWTWADVCRPLVDGYVLRALVRKRAEHERYLREEIFAADYLAAAEREAMSREALALGQQCSDTLGAIQQDQAEMKSQLGAIPRLGDALERCTETMEKVGRSLETMNREQGRVAGVLEEMSKRRRYTDGLSE